MDVKTALDQHVRQRLEDTFGRAMATMIFASATNTVRCSNFDPDRADYLALVEAICNDQRVVDLWGRSGSETQLRQWRELV